MRKVTSGGAARRTGGPLEDFEERSVLRRSWWLGSMNQLSCVASSVPAECDRVGRLYDDDLDLDLGDTTCICARESSFLEPGHGDELGTEP